MADRHSARVALNILFREVALSAQKNTEHAKEFNQSVQVESVEDYLDFVNPGDATACIEQILSRTRSCFYTTASQFRGDFERILANAMVGDLFRLLWYLPRVRFFRFSREDYFEQALDDILTILYRPTTAMVTAGTPTSPSSTGHRTCLVLAARRLKLDTETLWTPRRGSRYP